MALPGFAKFFKKSADEEKEHAGKLMKFQSKRGGRVKLSDIKKPAKDEWGSGLEAMEAALELERTVNQALLDLHKIADKHGDFHVSAACRSTTEIVSQATPFNLCEKEGLVNSRTASCSAGMQ